MNGVNSSAAAAGTETSPVIATTAAVAVATNGALRRLKRILSLFSSVVLRPPSEWCHECAVP